MSSSGGGLLTPTDPAILEAGTGGERLVARMRVIFWGAIWTIPLFVLLTMPGPPPEILIGFVAASIAVAIAVVFLLLARRKKEVPSLPFVTAGVDVTLVGAALAAIALAGRAEVAINSMIIWPIFLLAILATSLRLDPRVTLFAGALSVVEYLAILLSVAATTPVGWHIQLSRLLLQVVATALALGIVRQSQRLAHISGTDRLTGLDNRTLFDERLVAEITRADRSGETMSLVMFDIDRFKLFNDRWGHDVGDAALKTVAGVLKAASRRGDTVARWGGEELVMILPDTDRAGAVMHVERIRERLRDTGLEVAGEVRLTVSAGVAEFPTDGRIAMSLLLSADRRLLAAKRKGRDRVIAEG